MKRAMENISYKIESCRAALIGEMRSLANDLRLEALRLEGDPILYPNSLGTVQAQGTIIDANCGRLSGLMEAKELIEAAINQK